MALFLSETMEAPVVDMSIEEAYDGLLEATMEMSELNEAMLQGDFILHEQIRTSVLTEEEGAAKEANFVVNAGKKLKEFLVRLRDKVVAFFKKVGAIVAARWAKITGGKQVSAPANSEAEVSKVAAAYQKALTVVSGLTSCKTAQEVKSKVGNTLTALKGAVESAKAKITGAGGKTEISDSTKWATVAKTTAAAGAASAVLYKAFTFAAGRAEEGSKLAAMIEKAKEYKAKAMEAINLSKAIQAATSALTPAIAFLNSAMGKVKAILPGGKKD